MFYQTWLLEFLALMFCFASERITRPEQELLARYLLQRLLGKDGHEVDPDIARIARDDLATSSSIVYPEVGKFDIYFFMI